MIIFKKIKMKNIFSYGNVMTEVDLNKDKSTLVVGTNGAGKSSFLEAITFALYGKPYRKVNKAQLVNSINNKDLLVELDIEVDSSQYKIRRGIKPNLFEIIKDGELIPQDGKVADYQSKLENEILKMSFKSYGQIVVLGTASFTPFMKLDAKDRRAFIEDLIGLEIFSNMNELLKNKVKDNKTAILDNNHQTEMLSLKLNAFNEKKMLIEKNTQNRKEEINKKMKDILSKTDKDVAERDRLISEIEDLRADVSNNAALVTRKSKMQQLKVGIQAKQKANQNDVEFFKHNDNCPTCKQLIAAAHREGIVADYANKMEEIIDGLSKLEEKIIENDEVLESQQIILDKIKALEKEKLSYDTSIHIHKGNLSTLYKELTNKDNQVTIDESEGKKLEDMAPVLETSRLDLLNEKDILSISGLLLKDGGIKAKIISKYIPKINKQVNAYLSAFDFFVDFRIDENFNETIKSRYRDAFSYDSFSQGEKAKIDISLMLTWRHMAKMRNSVATNILILDEVFDGSTDSEGVENLKKILNDEDSNYIVISHKTETHEGYFDRVLVAKKEKNFTNLREISYE